MLKEFRTFIARGNVLDLAVAVVVGAAFGRIVTSLTDDILMPVIGRIFGGLDFSGYFFRMGAVPAGYRGSLTDYAALKKAGVPLLGYGQFATVLVNFVLIAFIVFLIVRAVNRATRIFEREQAQAAEQAVPEAAEIALLREIRDAVRDRGA